MKGLAIVWTASVVAALVAGFAMGRGSSVSPAHPGELTREHKPVAVATSAHTFDSSDTSTTPARHATAGKSAKDQLTLALGITDPRTRDRQMDNALGEANLASVKAALEWAASLPDGAGKHAAMQKIMERWGQLDGPAATAYGEKTLAESGNVQPLRSAVRGWGQTNPEGALQYAQSMGVADGIRREATRDVFRDWADRNPQAAAAYAAGANPQIGWGGATRIIADRWSQQDPQTAATWAMSLPPGNDQRHALDQLVGNWASQNLQAAASFVNSQPEGPGRDVMVSRLAREIAGQDPAAALHWAASLGDQGAQVRAAAGVVWRATGRDPAAAAQLLQNSPIAPEVQQQILARMSGGPQGNRGGHGPGPSP